jgi:mono/diheme cytochrome c family protein
MSREIKADRSPSAAIGAWVFGLAGVSFLLAIIVAALAIQGEPGKSAPLGGGGRIFMGEGCLECHSRMVRETDPVPGPRASELESGGVADGLYGSSRVGPDLQNIAGVYSPSRLRTRLTDPAALQPGTIMPSYSYLSESELDSLIQFLEQPAEWASKWDAVRETNGIERDVPDTVLREIAGRFDPETNALTLPVENTPSLTAVARGIYDSRCAACHGMEGRGNSSVFPGAAPDFTSSEMSGRSLVWWYWRISDGVPGTAMPGWGGHLSEKSIWLLALFLNDFESEEPAEIMGEEIEGSVVGTETLFAPEPSDATATPALSAGTVDIGPVETDNGTGVEGPT